MEIQKQTALRQLRIGLNKKNVTWEMRAEVEE